MQKAAKFFPLADRDRAIDITGLLTISSVIVLSFKCLEKPALFCIWSEKDVGKNILASWGTSVTTHSDLPQLPEGKNYRSSSEFQGNKNRLHSQRLTAHHSCPDALAEGIVHAGVTNGLQRKLYRHWNSKVLHWSKSVLYVRGMTKPHIWEIVHSVPPQVVHPQEISAWVTYMVVELPGHFWCHQSHFHPYPHTNNIHC